MKAMIEISRLTKSFGRDRVALRNVSIVIRHGEMVGLIGPSGSGKSTLLRHISGLTVGDRADAGSISVTGNRIQQRGKLARDIRKQRARIGFVFQQFNLVDRLPVEANVLAGRLGKIPVWRSILRRFTVAERRAARRALARVGIPECCAQRASTLSGGQQQRAAIARALVQEAEVILADEPVASLDPESSRRVMEILSQINREDGIAVIVTLHQVEIAKKYCSRIVALKEGEIVFDGPAAELDHETLNDVYGTSVFGPDDDIRGAEEQPPAAAVLGIEVRRRAAVAAASV